MSMDINLSLDELIKRKKNSNKKNANPKRRGSQNGFNRFSGDRKRSGSGGRLRSLRSKVTNRFQPYQRGDIDSEWSHDMYDDENEYSTRKRSTDGSTKILISNLDFGVTDSDLEELFAEIGNLVSVEIHYDKSGRSLGTGSVVFEDRTDAAQAINQYNGIPLDGRPMKIEFAAPSPQREPRFSERRTRSKTFRTRRNGGSGGVNGGGGIRRKRQRFGGGVGGRNIGGKGRRRRQDEISAEQLDAELDEYRAKGI